MPGGAGCSRRGGGGLLEPLVLAALCRQESHGYDLRRTILESTRGDVSVDMGGLYRVLRRLEDEGLVASEWAAGEGGPQRRDYRITGEGTARLADWSAHLRERSRLLGMVAEVIDDARPHTVIRHQQEGTS